MADAIAVSDHGHRFGTMRLLGPAVVWRYSALAIQFVTVLLITNRAPLDVAGHYFGLFGAATSLYALAGLGAADGLVRMLPVALETQTTSTVLRRFLWRATLRSMLVTVLLVALGMALVAGASAVNALTILLAGAWALGYALVFLLAQTVLALGSPPRGTFWAYTSINLAYTVTLVPYLLLADRVTLTGLLASAVAGTTLALLGAVLALVRSARTLRPGSSDESPRSLELTALIRCGLPMMFSRLLQGAIPWIPVWLLIAFGSPDWAAIYAAGSRLMVVATSALAAVRFAVRPKLVMLSHSGQLRRVAVMARQYSLFAAVLPVTALGLLLLFPASDLEHLLGSGYDATHPVLVVLSIAALFEAFGGISDEILKMSDRASVVLVSQLVAILVQVGMGMALLSLGPTMIAIGTATAFLLQYTYQRWGLHDLLRHTRAAPAGESLPR